MAVDVKMSKPEDGRLGDALSKIRFDALIASLKLFFSLFPFESFLCRTFIFPSSAVKRLALRWWNNSPGCWRSIHFRPWQPTLAESQWWSIQRRLLHGWTALTKRALSWRDHALHASWWRSPERAGQRCCCWWRRNLFESKRKEKWTTHDKSWEKLLGRLVNPSIIYHFGKSCNEKRSEKFFC